MNRVNKKVFLSAAFVIAAVMVIAGLLNSKTDPYIEKTAVGARAGIPDDPHIHYVGRWDQSNPKVFKSNWPGAYFRVNFTGTTARLKLEAGSDIFVSIDNGADVYYAYMPGEDGMVNLTPTPLEPGIHSLRVTARSEKDKVAFAGLILDENAQTLPAERREKWIEFVGDSITAGCCASNANWVLRSYAWLAAEQLQADHTQIAYSGICLVDGVKCASPNEIGMSKQYFKLHTVEVPDSPTWSFTGRQPDMVVVNLGTNDYNNGVTAEVFQEQYAAFIQRIRSHYPAAAILVLGTLADMLTEPTIQAVQQVAAAGDVNVHFIDTKGWVDAGLPDFEDQLHPSDYGHEKIAGKLVTIIRELWQQQTRHGR
ncbi:SGNH/GDSL hydrolase family protein [Paenibacillus mendelii]|uniref:GDSL-type esterase/lipase family protein n=1 Tax=Paenibacillus mendelii TaxID=206163 RepID=A0ABV6J1S0_9BACL|nr:SGNH/GDSL hydrolase family protein [Paenibacillus mendelii]MCQ6562746.1 GDSL-type esterase/lipase family protein [Paenibacillus mendelii]